MITMRVRASGNGRVVKWSEFKQGKLTPSSPWDCLLSTVLTDVVTDIIDEAKAIDPACRMTPLFLSGFTTASFDITIKGESFQVVCGRRLVRGWFPLNPIAAEFGRNYDVLVTICAVDATVEDRLVSAVRGKYECAAELSLG